MFRLFTAAGAGVVAGLLYVWQNMQRRVFDVRVTQRRVTFSAAREDQCICRIEVELRDREELEEAVRFTRPETYTINRDNQIVNLNVSANVSNAERGKLIIEVYARLTVAGSYTLIPKFNDLGRINLVEGSVVNFDVQPSEANSLKVRKVKQQRRSNVSFDDENDFELYKGGEAQVFVEVMDKYGNTVKDEELKVANSPYLDYKSCHFDERNCCTLVTIFCRDDGKTLLTLESHPHHIQRRVPINIVPAPMDPERCNLRLDKNRQVVAGQLVRLKLELRDIYSNPFKLENTAENQLRFSLRGHVFHRLVESCKAYGDCCEGVEHFTGFSTWYLDWTPKIAGRRSFRVCVDGEQRGTNEVRVDVDPGPLKSLQIACYDDLGEKNRSKCYTNEKCNACLNGFDEFGNTVQLDADHWYLEVEDDKEIITETTIVGKNIIFTYSFQEEGTYSVLVATQIQREVSVPESFVVKVTEAPLDPSKCKISTETPLFGQRPSKVKLRLELFDCNSMPYHYSKLDRNAFEFKFNCVSSNMESREHIDSSEPNVTYFKPCVNIEEDTVSCFLEVFYKGKLLGSPLQLDVIQILPYREDDYLSDVEDPKTVLDMYNMTKAKVIGEDYSNLDNVNRILWRNYDKGIARSEIVTMDDHRRVSVNITMFEPTQRVFVRRVFSNVIKGLHYRNQASKFNKQREDWKTKSIEAYRNNSYEDAKEYSEIKDKFGELMNTSNWRASYAVFEFFNHGRQANEIDLHGQLVADEAKLNSHKMQLLEKRNEDEVQKIINTERDEMDEAIRHLRDKIDQVKDNADWLEIIVGAGHHSRAQLQKISPKVKKFLTEMGWEYELCNKGSLLITFREYNGKQPCRATFYCSECDKTWVSNSSWKGKWQKCFRCDKKGIDSKCNPLKLGCREQSRAQRRRTTNEWNSFTQEDHRRLCQVCIEKGEDCRTV